MSNTPKWEKVAHESRKGKRERRHLPEGRKGSPVYAESLPIARYKYDFGGILPVYGMSE
jgi:hypothetical protein